MSKRLFLVLIVVALIQGCNKNRKPVQWAANYSFPIAYGSLGISNLIADSLLTTNTNSSLNVHFKRNLYELNLDSLIDLPDNQITNTFALPFPVGVDFNPGQTFINQPEEQTFDINTVELKEFEIESAVLSYSIRSTIVGEIIYDYTVNSAIDQNGNPFSISVTVPSAQNGIPSEVSGTIQIPQTTWNLQGISGGEVNTLLTTISVKVSNSNTNAVSVSNLDTIFIENEIESISAISAKGFFGQEQIQVGPEIVPLDFLSKFISGSIETGSIDLNLELSNGVGADFKLLINQLSSIRDNTTIDLVHPIIGQIQNINRAFLTGSSVNSSIFSTDINSANSNVNDFVNQLPNSIGYEIGIELNPLGNISGHNDFIFKSNPLKLDVDFITPLSFAANQLTLRDTLTLSIENNNPINNGTLYIETTNGFPLSAELKLHTFNSSYQLLNPGFFPSAIVNSNNIVSEPSFTTHSIDLSEDILNEIKNSKKIILEVVFNTPIGNSPVDFYDHYKIDFKISADFNATVSVP